MTRLVELDEGFYVAGQVDPAEVPDWRAQGIVAVINNRPDGEEAGQPAASAVQAACAAAGLACHHVPVTMQTLSPEVVDAFQAARREATGPVLAFCRSGMRSTLLWALAEARYGERSAEALLEQARQAGYDLSSAAGLLEQLAAMPRPAEPRA